MNKRQKNRTFCLYQGTVQYYLNGKIVYYDFFITSYRALQNLINVVRNNKAGIGILYWPTNTTTPLLNTNSLNFR